MFKTFFLIVLTVFVVDFTDKIFFVHPDNSYAFLVPNTTELVRVDTLSEQSDTYTLSVLDTLGEFKYIISVTTIEKDLENLFDNTVIEDYEKDCKCTVIDKTSVQFNNFEGVKYNIMKKQEDLSFLGEVYITTQNHKSINVLFLAPNNNVNLYKNEIKEILNSLVLNF